MSNQVIAEPTAAELILIGRALREAKIAEETAQLKVIKSHCNRRGYSEVYPFEVVRTISATTVEVREMIPQRDPSWKPEIIPGGFAGHCVNQQKQSWFYKSEPNFATIRVRWSESKRQWQDKHGNRYSMADAPRYFYDYNF